MDIVKYGGEGYSTVIRYEGWRIGLIRRAERFDNLSYFERHMKTNEVFILLEGGAVLYTADGDMNISKYVMETGTLYNVRAAEWHAVTLSADALVMVVENADTSRENSEYYYIDKGGAR